MFALAIRSLYGIIQLRTSDSTITWQYLMWGVGSPSDRASLKDRKCLGRILGIIGMYMIDRYHEFELVIHANVDVKSFCSSCMFSAPFSIGCNGNRTFGPKRTTFHDGDVWRGSPS